MGKKNRRQSGDDGMSWKKIGASIGKVAPYLGAALGGPGGAAIGELLSKALGVDATPDAVAAAVKADPQAALKLREFELQNEQHIREHSFKVLDAELKDVQNARAEHKHSIMPSIITGIMTAMAAFYGVALFNLEFPESNRDMINNFGGQLMMLWVASIVYWIGTTRSSAEKDRRLIK
jgi:hypothetical protein